MLPQNGLSDLLYMKETRPVERFHGAGFVLVKGKSWFS